MPVQQRSRRSTGQRRPWLRSDSSNSGKEYWVSANIVSPRLANDAADSASTPITLLEGAPAASYQYERAPR